MVSARRLNSGGPALPSLFSRPRGRVGGKTLSLDASPKGGKVDVGAAWLNDTTQSEMFALARDFGFDLIPQRDSGFKLQQNVDGSIVAKPYRPDDVSLRRWALKFYRPLTVA